MNDSTKSSFSPEALQLFMVSLKGLDNEEIKKIKELYIRNAISEYDTEVKKDKAAIPLLVMFALIPLFWPFVYLAFRRGKTDHEAKRNAIENAMMVWKDDLWDKHTELLALLNKDGDKTRQTSINSQKTSF